MGVYCMESLDITSVVTSARRTPQYVSPACLVTAQGSESKESISIETVHSVGPATFTIRTGKNHIFYYHPRYLVPDVFHRSFGDWGLVGRKTLLVLAALSLMWTATHLFLLPLAILQGLVIAGTTWVMNSWIEKRNKKTPQQGAL